MRATPLPTAFPVAASVIRLLTVVLMPLVVPSAALAERWLRPVPGGVARPFAYPRAAPFAAGAHRGADLAARPGAAVRAACGGTVAFAGAVAGRERVVSLRCGARRVTHLPLARVSVRAGTAVRAGTPIGTVAGGHGGLHLGVRRASDPFGYEDPLALLPPTVRAPPPIATRPRHTGRPRSVRTPRAPAAPAAVRVTRPHPATARPHPATATREGPGPHAAPVIPGARSSPRPRAAPVAAGGDGVAPWPVWAGVALVLCGAAGSRTITLRRRRPQPGRRAMRTSTLR